MKAIVVYPPHPGVQIVNINFEFNEIKPLEILAKPIYIGICGTDRELANGLLKHSTPPFGKNYMIIGHEVIAQIIGVGEKVSSIKEGDKVIALVRRECGECISCKLGRPDMCETGNMQVAGIKGKDGFMVDKFVDEARYFVKIPDSLISEEAVLIQPLGDIIKAVDTALKVEDSRFVWSCEDSTYNCRSAGIIGSGVTGYLFGAYLRLLGFDVTIYNRREFTEEERKLADYIGTKVEIIGREAIPIDLLIDTSGSISSLYKLISKVKPKGIVVLFGFGINDSSTINSQLLTEIVYKNILIMGSAAHAKIHLEKAVQVFSILKKEFPMFLRGLITRKVRVNEALEYIKNKQRNEKKIVIEWS